MRTPPPPLREEDPPDPHERICVGCLTPPVHVVWSQADGRLLHASPLTDLNGLPRMCGGLVVPKGQEWRHALAPGVVVPCCHVRSGVMAHLVRLGRPGGTGGPSWTGTALCGRMNPGRNRLWRPLSPVAAAQTRLCGDCRQAQVAEARLEED